MARMMRLTIGSWVKAAALVLACAVATTPDPADAADEICLAPAAWFPHAQTPAPDPNGSFETNCAFNQWSFQQFLYLTQDQGDGYNSLETWADPKSLFLGNPPAPWPPKPHALPTYCEGGQTVEGGKRTVRPRDNKADLDISIITQAGDNEILFDQAGQVVYYDERINETYYSFMLQNGFYTADAINKADGGQNYPVGAVELKTTWRVAEAGGRIFIPDAASRFHVVDAYLQPLGKDCVEDARMALIAVHIAGVVKDHPEFLWSTFQHVDNAPACSATPVAGHGPRGEWSLYKAGMNCGPDGACNTGSTELPPEPFPPTQVCQMNPWGGGGDESVANVQSLNASVYVGLADDSVWKNYQMIGTLYTDGTVPPIEIGGVIGNEKGSLKLANPASETFIQQHNCFYCHTIFKGPGACLDGVKHLYISHLVGLVCSRDDN